MIEEGMKFRDFSDSWKKRRENLNHRSMAEEHRCEPPEGHRLCVNNCGFFGSTATMNLCSKCYSAIRLKEQEEASTKSTIETALSSSSSAKPSSSTSPPPSAVDVLMESPPPSAAEVEVAVTVTVTVAVASSSISINSGSVAQPNRCATCRKRVGLTGFKCRCGVTFCGAHRYPEEHACGFDFKTVGREEIARANPVIKAEKLRRI
ncbi:hypothetical protein JHK82_027172 [Glycine max]|nr:hypothetical protein JHK82_027172 [Glycine max]